jgi:pimeloyl-ACP methyl ester carboxylesterase
MEVERRIRAPDGAVIGYRLWRPGARRRLLILIHGLASNLTRWWDFAATTRLRGSWDILRLDLRGHAGSLCRGPIGMDQWCGDLATILRVEEMPGALLAGHCLGANVALHFADRHPEAATGLVLIEPMFRGALSPAMRRVAALRPLIASIVPVVRALNALGLHRRRVPLLDLERLDREARAVIAAAGAFPEERYASPLEDLRTTATLTYLQDLLAVTAPLPDLSRVRAPALALLSLGGAFGDPSTTERLLAPLRTCEVVRLDARHWIPTERPAEMREAIERWCARFDLAS